MTLTHRRILYSFFFLIFFITAPIVILWAEGYRYNSTKHRLQKTGVLFLESKPAGAKIYLNGKIQKGKTTAHFKNLLPDDYQIVIKKDGYQTWQKKITVQPGQTTFAQYIRLFKENPEPKNILSLKIIATSEAQNGSIAFIYEQMPVKSSLQQNQDLDHGVSKVLKLALFNLGNQNLNDLIVLDFQPDEIILSPNKSFIALKTAKQTFIVNVGNKKLINLSKIIKKEVTRLHWSETVRDETLYAISKNSLEKINLISEESLTLFQEPILDFYLINNTIFFLQKTKDNVLLNKTSFNNMNNVETLTSLPISDHYEFYSSPSSYLILIDEKNKILYLINTSEKKKIKIFPETDYVKWFQGGKILLFGNNFETSTYDLEKKEENLIVRLSSQIKKVIWYPIATHLIYSVPDGVKIIEIINHQRNLNTLIEKSDIQDIFVNSRGDKIYFIDKTGLSEVEIQ